MPISYIIIAITCLVSYSAWKNAALMGKLILNPYKVVQKREWLRVIGSGFIHADLNHLIMNMLVFFFFGPALESDYANIFGADTGDIFFALLYLVAIPTSSMFDIFKHKDNYGYNALGASGATSAILFAFILIHPLEELQLYFIFPIPAILFAIGYLWYSSYMSKRNVDNIGHNAHFYGAIFGVVFTLLLKPSLIINFYETILARLT